MATDTLTRAAPPCRLPPSTLLLLLPTALLIAVLFVTTAMHNRQRHAQAEQFNARLAEMTTRHNQQPVTLTEEHNNRSPRSTGGSDEPSLPAGQADGDN